MESKDFNALPKDLKTLYLYLEDIEKEALNGLKTASSMEQVHKRQAELALKERFTQKFFSTQKKQSNESRRLR